MLTEFGKIIINIRNIFTEGRKNMADKLEISEGHLSGIEEGIRSTPYEWIELIPKLYNLDLDVKNNLQYIIRYTKAESICKETLALDDETKEMIISLLLIQLKEKR